MKSNTFKLLLIFASVVCTGWWTAFGQSAPEPTTYQIRNIKGDELLRPRDANAANGTPIALYPARPWKCMTWRLQAAGDSGFTVKNLFTSKTFCVNTNSTVPPQAVTQLPLAKNPNDAPHWQFLRLEDGSYKIADNKSGQVLTAVELQSHGEFSVVEAAWQNLTEQKWRLEKIDPKDLTM